MDRGRPADFVLGLSPTRLLVAAAALLMVYLAFLAVTNAVHARQLRQEEARLERALQEKQQQEARLQALREYMRSDQYVEAVARRELGLVYPGETNVVVVSPPPERRETGGWGHWWERYFR